MDFPTIAEAAMLTLCLSLKVSICKHNLLKHLIVYFGRRIDCRSSSGQRQLRDRDNQCQVN